MVSYLSACGVGTLGLVDADNVDLSNLHRQTIYRLEDQDTSKVGATIRYIKERHPKIRLEAYDERITAGNVADFIQGYDVVADGTDNIETRRVIHQACLNMKVPLVSAAVQGLDGQMTTYKAYMGEGHPCMECVFGDNVEDDILPSCAQGGVLGAAGGVMGSLQAVEVIKELLELGESLSGRLMLYDALSSTFMDMKLTKRPDCHLCG